MFNAIATTVLSLFAPKKQQVQQLPPIKKNNDLIYYGVIGLGLYLLIKK